jgi:hypothetical protein
LFVIASTAWHASPSAAGYDSCAIGACASLLFARNRIILLITMIPGNQWEIPRWSAVRSDRVQVDDLPEKDDPDETHALTKRSNRSVNGGPEMTGDLAKIEEPLAVTFQKILNDLL